MEHWFDDLVKGMARGALSRRGILKGTLQAGLAGLSVAGGLDGLAEGVAVGSPFEPGAPRPPVTTEKRGPCTVEYDAGAKQSTMRHAVQSTVEGKLLTDVSQITFTHPAQRGQAPQIKSTRSITLGSDLLLRIDKQSHGSSVDVKVTYGTAFHGIQEATFTSDGKVTQGTIDGRRTLQFPVGIDANSIKFADGNPPPAISLNAALEQALNAIRQKAKDDISSCGQEATGRASTAGGSWRVPASNQVAASRKTLAFARKLKRLSPLGLTLAPATSGFVSPWASPEPVAVGGEPSAMPAAALPDPAPPQVGGQACQDCQNNCAVDYGICETGAGVGCIFTLFGAGACEAAAAAGCAAIGAICLNKCDQDGGACCPVGCPNGGCCDQGQQCTPTQDLCCASNVFVCAGGCCPPGFICKDNVCCTTDRAVCAGVCCPEGQACSTEGICCPQVEANTKPVSCNHTCCPKDTYCCGGGSYVEVCCPNGQKCLPVANMPSAKTCCADRYVCGDVCCQAEQSCCGGKCVDLCLDGQMIGCDCCPNERACGKVCCPPGLSCVDGSCQTVTCPPGQYKCSGPVSGGPYATICCPDKNAVCCNKQCCKSGEICYTLTEGGPFVCGQAPPIK